MHKDGDEVQVTATEARAGTTPHIVRYMLAASLALVIIVLAVTLLVQG